MKIIALFLCCLIFLSGCSDKATSSGNGASANTVSSKPVEVSSTVTSTENEESDSVQSVIDSGEIRIRLTFSGEETIAVLEDNPTTQSLLAQLPITVTFGDFAGAEKIAYFPKNLSTQGAPDGDNPELGDVACYGPWGNLVFYYKDQPYAGGIIPMGRVESGLNELGAMGTKFEVTIERIK